MAMESPDPLLAIVVVDGPPPPCERMIRMKMRRKIKQEPRRFPTSFDADEHQRKTDELAQGWKRRQQAKHKRGKLDDSRLDRVPVELWSVTDVLMWLDRVNLASLKLNFDEHDIDGPALLELGPRRLDEIGVRALAHRKTVARLVRELVQSQEHKEKLDSQSKGKSSLKHWSSLQPVSQNQVSGDEGQANAGFDEAGARADFQRAVMAWRAQHGRPQISNERASEGMSKSGLGKKSLLASFDFGSGDTTETSQWKNPFA